MTDSGGLLTGPDLQTQPADPTLHDWLVICYTDTHMPSTSCVVVNTEQPHHQQGHPGWSGPSVSGLDPENESREPQSNACQHSAPSLLLSALHMDQSRPPYRVGVDQRHRRTHWHRRKSPRWWLLMWTNGPEVGFDGTDTNSTDAAAAAAVH